MWYFKLQFVKNFMHLPKDSELKPVSNQLLLVSFWSITVALWTHELARCMSQHKLQQTRIKLLVSQYDGNAFLEPLLGAQIQLHFAHILIFACHEDQLYAWFQIHASSKSNLMTICNNIFVLSPVFRDDVDKYISCVYLFMDYCLIGVSWQWWAQLVDHGSILSQYKTGLTREAPHSVLSLTWSQSRLPVICRQVIDFRSLRHCGCLLKRRAELELNLGSKWIILIIGI